MAFRENHEKWREEIEAFFNSQRPAGLNDRIRAVKKRMCKRVVRYERPGSKIVLQNNSNAEQ